MTTVAFEPRKKENSLAGESSNGHITQERYDAVVAALREYKRTTGTTSEGLAQALGGNYSVSTINVFLSKGGYPDIQHARHLIERAEQFLALIDERRALITQPQFVMTSVSKRIYALVKRCTLLTKIGVAACESGTGKTRTLQEWHVTHPNSVLIRANRTFCPTAANTVSVSTPYTTLYKLAQAVGACDRSNSRSQLALYDAIVTNLRGSNKLVIIDEAHFLPGEALDVIRTIHEDANVPFILAGHSGLYDKGPRDHESLIAFRSRSLRERITTTQIRATDVEMIATQIVGVEVAKDASRVLLQEAQASGGLRRLVTLLQVAQTFGNGERVGKAEVLRAIEERPQDGEL